MHVRKSTYITKKNLLVIKKQPLVKNANTLVNILDIDQLTSDNIYIFVFCKKH